MTNPVPRPHIPHLVAASSQPGFKFLTSKPQSRPYPARVPLVMVLEHRFFGLSSENRLTVHTPENVIDDLAYFASNLKMPFLDDWLYGP